MITGPSPRWIILSSAAAFIVLLPTVVRHFSESHIAGLTPCGRKTIDRKRILLVLLLTVVRQYLTRKEKYIILNINSMNKYSTNHKASRNYVMCENMQKY